MALRMMVCRKSPGAPLAGFSPFAASVVSPLDAVVVSSMLSSGTGAPATLAYANNPSKSKTTKYFIFITG
uniref:Putative secreted protein n=1 Tax=Anopheles marajoara TaxID=58244 RepID=A0A2M4CF55_9DIPT